MASLARPAHTAVTPTRHRMTIGFILTVARFFTIDAVLSISANSFTFFTLVPRRTLTFSRLYVARGVILAFAEIPTAFSPSAFGAWIVASCANQSGGTLTFPI